MNSVYVCSACRRGLGQSRSRKVAQWLPRASFISLSNSPAITTDEKSAEIPSRGGNVDVGAGTIVGRRKRTPRQIYNAGDNLEALFKNSLKQPPSKSKEAPSLNLAEPYIRANKLRTMLVAEDYQVEDVWKFFVEHFGQKVSEVVATNKRTEPSQLRSIKATLAVKVREAKSRDPMTPNLPTVTEFSKVYAQLGCLNGADWVDMMFVLLESMLTLDPKSPEYLEHEERLATDLLGSWNVVFRHPKFPRNYPLQGSPLDWSSAPVFDASTALHAYQRRKAPGLFALLAPKFKFQQNLAAVAVASFALLTKSSLADKAVVQEALPLVYSLGTAIATRGFRVQEIWAGAITRTPLLLVDYLISSSSRIHGTAVKFSSNSISSGSDLSLLSESRSAPIVVERDARSTSQTIMSFNKRLMSALRRQDAVQVQNLWSDASRFPVVPDHEIKTESEVPLNKQGGTLTVELCNHFVVGFMSLRKPARAIQVWNHMVNSGITPDLKTWNSMLLGCKASKDAKALEDVWLKMLQLGVQPDVFCWTTRISGLIGGSEVPTKGLQALEEMGDIWLAANIPDPIESRKKKVVAPAESFLKPIKPTIETINATVAALLRKGMPEAAHRVIAWSTKFNITPDVTTYNTLLMPLIRDGRQSDALALLQQMRTAGIEADVGTFTTILDEILSGHEGITPREQRDITSNVLLEMERTGVKANIVTYGKMISKLLKNQSGDIAVINVVMEHMASHGIYPNAHIHTNILHHYLSFDPPDLDAVRNLIERVKHELGSYDHVFWEEAIKGLARSGDTISAMRILGKLEGDGSISWLSKQVLLTALVQNEDWENARSFVRNVKVDTSPSQEMRTHQQWFWKLAADYDLLS